MLQNRLQIYTKKMKYTRNYEKKNHFVLKICVYRKKVVILCANLRLKIEE